MAGREGRLDYWRGRHRLKATPINGRGWVRLILAATAPGMSLSFGARWLGDRYGPAAGLPTVLLTLAIGFAIPFVLIRAKGQRRLK